MEDQKFLIILLIIIILFSKNGKGNSPAKEVQLKEKKLNMAEPVKLVNPEPARKRLYTGLPTSMKKQKDVILSRLT